jgi:rubrerythrin
MLKEAADAIERLTTLVQDLQEALDDKHRLARELDAAMHGERGAAAQASLCDLIEPAKRLREKLEAALTDARERNDTIERLRADKRGRQDQINRWGRLWSDVTLENTRMRPIVETVQEWRKGCSCANAAAPEECPACTRTFLERLKALIPRP